MSSLENLSSWYSDWKNEKVIVYGLGVSGFSVADTLCELGSKILVVADKIEDGHRDLLEVLGIRYVEGLNQSEVIEVVAAFAPTLAIVSPGIRPSNFLVSWFDKNEVSTIGDIELAWRLRDKVEPSEWILITGTNGKTTTSQLVEAMLLADGKKALACGNIGVPVLDAIRDPEGWDYLVVEISSFQLHYLNRIAPLVGAVLNIAEDHIDWHGSFAEYQRVKGKVFEGATKSIIFNAEDEITRELALNADVADETVLAVSFTRGMPSDLQVGFVEEFLVDRAFYGYRASELPELATLEDIENIGVVTPHLLSNVAAAAAIARACAVSAEAIKAAVRSFKLDRHRIEFVANRSGVLWFDDSKATNPHAADASLKSFESVIWIVGGLLKGADINQVVKENAERLKAAVVIGLHQAEVLEALSSQAPHVPVCVVEPGEDRPMDIAVKLCDGLASAGDVVLLAPAAASMDQFVDYADRGEKFSRAVLELSDER